MRRRLLLDRTSVDSSCSKRRALSLRTSRRLRSGRRSAWRNSCELKLAANSSLPDQARGFLQRLERLAETGVPGIGTAPYYIVVAERSGIPPAEQQSLAHCLENMWLKATALGLGFQLVSVTAQMGRDREFSSVLGIPHGEFGTNGCAIGYPMKRPPL